MQAEPRPAQPGDWRARLVFLTSLRACNSGSSPKTRSIRLAALAGLPGMDASEHSAAVSESMSDVPLGGGGPKTSGVGFEGLAHEWEAELGIRARMRTHKVLVEDASTPMGFICKSVANLRHNDAVLRPLLKRMAKLTNKPLPSILAVENEVRELYSVCNEKTCATDKVVYQQAWGVRRLAQLMKGIHAKQGVPRVPCKKFAEIVAFL